MLRKGTQTMNHHVARLAQRHLTLFTADFSLLCETPVATFFFFCRLFTDACFEERGNYGKVVEVAGFGVCGGAEGAGGGGTGSAGYGEAAVEEVEVRRRGVLAYVAGNSHYLLEFF